VQPRKRSPASIPGVAEYPWEPDAIVVDVRRGRIVGMVLAVAVFGGLAAFFVWAAVAYRDDSTTRIAGWIVAAICLIPIVRLIVVRKRLLVSMGLAFDRRGLHYWIGGERGLLGWPQVAAVGIGYEAPPHIPSISLEETAAEFLADHIMKDRRRVALEIFPADPGLVAGTPALLPYRVAAEAPWPDVSGERWRILLPPQPGLPRTIAGAAQQVAPRHWRGWFRRPWTGGLVRVRAAE
jgi:hypothetical protein